MPRNLLFFFCVCLLWAVPTLAQQVCSFCRGDLDLKSLPYRDGARMVCHRCRSSSAACSQCHLPAPGKAYRDGRNLCPSCLNTGTFDKKKVDRLALEVNNYLKQLLGKEHTSNLPPIQLVDLDELQTKFNEGGRAMSVVAFYRPYNPEMVYLLSGESELQSCSHLVHELTHAWQSRACPPQDRALTEGFACWVQYQYLVSRGETAEAQRLTQHRDPDYGASLRKLLPRSQALGKEKFLQAVRKARNLSDI